MTKNKKRFLSLLLICIFIFQFPISNTYASKPSIKAASAIVIDQETGEVLFSKDPDSPRVPASMTKIMTAYIIFEEIEAGNLTKDTLVKVSPHVAKISTNKNYPMPVALEANASYTVDKFLELIMIPSASASCIAMAEHISGSEAEFVNRMNATAKSMGLNANFKNSHGAQPHYITARSMAKLIKNFLDKYPDILNYTSLKSITFRGRTYNNTNRLLSSYKYEGANGFKTGTIPSAGFCLASTAKQNGTQLIGVIMKSTDNHHRHNDSKLILDYSFKKVNERNNLFKNTTIDFNNIPKSIRLNTDYEFSVTPKNIEKSYNANIVWKINDEIIKTENNKIIENNKPINLKYYTKDTNIENLNISFELYINNENKKEIILDIPINSESPAVFRDINNSKFEKSIIELKDKKILNGYTEDYFGINKEVSRAVFLSSLGRIVENLNLETIEENEIIFKDVDVNQYYSKYITWANKNNIANGDGEYFYPNRIINREEAATIMNNFLNKYNISFEELNLEFIDKNNISNWAEISIFNILNKNIMSLYEDNSFQPTRKVLRGEMSPMLLDCYNLLNEIEVEVE